MSFFDTKLMGDLMQRMNDHNRIEKFLTTQMLERYVLTAQFRGVRLCIIQL